MEFLSEESDFSKKSREEDPNAIGGNFVLWVVAIMVLLGLNAFSWIFCMYVFGHPEEPFNYKLLSKLDKIPPLEGFEPASVPRGKFHTVKEIYGQVFNYNDVELANYNDIKKRHYLKNYYERDDVTFIGGDFEVKNIRRLTQNDVFQRGFAVRAVAEGFPDAMVDFVIPAGGEGEFKDEEKTQPLADIKVPESLYSAGEKLTIEESTTCAALLHVDRQDNDLMVFTVVPLVERSFKAANGNEIECRPPQRLNLAARTWPMSNNDLVSNPIAPKTEETDEASPVEEDDKVASSGAE